MLNLLPSSCQFLVTLKLQKKFLLKKTWFFLLFLLFRRISPFLPIRSSLVNFDFVKILYSEVGRFELNIRTVLAQFSRSLSSRSSWSSPKKSFRLDQLFHPGDYSRVRSDWPAAFVGATFWWRPEDTLSQVIQKSQMSQRAIRAGLRTICEDGTSKYLSKQVMQNGSTVYALLTIA